MVALSLGRKRSYHGSIPGSSALPAPTLGRLTSVARYTDKLYPVVLYRCVHKIITASRSVVVAGLI